MSKTTLGSLWPTNAPISRHGIGTCPVPFDKEKPLMFWRADSSEEGIGRKPLQIRKEEVERRKIQRSEDRGFRSAGAEEDGRPRSHAFWGPAFGSISRRGLGDPAGRSFLFRFEDDAHLSIQHPRDPAQHAERMTFVPGGFEPADLLLRGLQFAGEFRLRETGLLTQRGQLQGHVPGRTSLFETLGELWVAELFLQKSIKVRLALHSYLSSQSRIRARAVSRSRIGMVRALLRMA